MLQSEDATVVALFVSTTEMLRMSVDLYAKHHREVKIAANVATGRELFELLGAGLRPAVLVLDLPLDDMELPDLLSRAAALIPDAAVLVSTRVSCEETLGDLLLTFPRHGIMLKPWSMNRLFSQVYRLGADPGAGHAYMVRNTCSRLLDVMQAESSLNGRTYLQEMVTCSILAEQECGIGELKAMVAHRHKTDVDAVTSALNRVNRKMHLRGNGLYRRFALQNGKNAEDRLPLGDLVKSLANEVRYELNC